MARNIASFLTIVDVPPPPTSDPVVMLWRQLGLVHQDLIYTYIEAKDVESFVMMCKNYTNDADAITQLWNQLSTDP